MGSGTQGANTPNAAKDAGLIDPAQLARMTDGTVSMQDVRTARALAARHAGQEKGDLAMILYNALAAREPAQAAVANTPVVMKDRAARKP